MYGGNFIFPLFSFPNFLWWSYVTFIKMPFHKIKCRLVSLKVFMLEVAMGPSTVFFGRFDQIIRAITRTSPYCGQRLLLTQSRKKKKSFLHTLMPQMSKAQTTVFPAPQYWGTNERNLFSHLYLPWTICWPGWGMLSLPPHPPLHMHILHILQAQP